jgi:hypothetical protein
MSMRGPQNSRRGEHGDSVTPKYFGVAAQG